MDAVALDLRSENFVRSHCQFFKRRLSVSMERLYLRRLACRYVVRCRDDLWACMNACLTQFADLRRKEFFSSRNIGSKCDEVVNEASEKAAAVAAVELDRVSASLKVLRSLSLTHKETLFH